MIRICSWCRRVLDGAVAVGEPLPDGYEDTVHCEVSHGLCAECFDERFGDELADVEEVAHG